MSLRLLDWPPAPSGLFAGAARASAYLRGGWTDAQRQEQGRLEGAWREANEAVMAAGRAASAGLGQDRGAQGG